jgi:hypothetical protein
MSNFQSFQPPEPSYKTVASRASGAGYDIVRFRKDTGKWILAHFNEAILLTRAGAFSGYLVSEPLKDTFISWCNDTRAERLASPDLAALSARVDSLESRVSALEQK